MKRLGLLLLMLGACAGGDNPPAIFSPPVEKGLGLCLGSFPIEAQAAHAGCMMLTAPLPIVEWDVVEGNPTTVTPRRRTLEVCGPWGNYKVIATAQDESVGCVVFTIHGLEGA